MKEASFAKRYIRRWADYESSYDELARNDPRHGHWDRPKDLPAGGVGASFSDGLVCAYAGDHRRAGMFFRRAIDYANRLEVEDRFHDTEVAEAGYPRSHAEVIRARALGRWLLGEPLNRADLRRAAEMFATWCLTKASDHRRFSSSLTMDFYLQGVRAALMAHDLDYARCLLSTKHRLRWHHSVERDLWTRLVNACPRGDAKLRDDIECFFDRIRDPAFEEVLDGVPTAMDREALALDTGLMREMYVVNASPYDDPSPQAVIDAVAR